MTFSYIRTYCLALVLAVFGTLFFSSRVVSATTLVYSLNTSQAVLRLSTYSGGDNGLVSEREFGPRDYARLVIDTDKWNIGFVVHNESFGQSVSPWLLERFDTAEKLVQLNEILTIPFHLELTVFGYDDYWIEHCASIGGDAGGGSMGWYCGTQKYVDTHTLPIDFEALEQNPRSLLDDGSVAGHFTETAGSFASVWGTDSPFMYGEYLISKHLTEFYTTQYSHLHINDDLDLDAFSLTGLKNPHLLVGGRPDTPTPEPATILLMSSGLLIAVRLRRR